MILARGTISPAWGNGVSSFGCTDAGQIDPEATGLYFGHRCPDPACGGIAGDGFTDRHVAMLGTDTVE